MFEKQNRVKKFLSLSLLFTIGFDIYSNQNEELEADPSEEIDLLEDGQYEDQEEETLRTISRIIISGNNYVPESAIRAKIPYREQEVFDPQKTNTLIKNLWRLGFFKDIKIMGDYKSDTTLDLHVIVETKKKLVGVTYHGNKNLKEKEIEKKLNISQIVAIDENELDTLAQQIKKMYAEKNYLHTQIKIELIENDDNTAKAAFYVEEGKKSIIKRINFTGNKSIATKTLRNLIFTREDWVLGFMDKSGTYLAEMIEQDKHILSNYYQSNGFLTAHVKNIDVKEDPRTHHMEITFDIEEGDLFYINSFSLPGNNVLTEYQLKSNFNIQKGELYSKEKIFKIIEQLRLIWGEYGYIFADIEPSIQPNFEEKTVDVTLTSDLGQAIRLNRINIIGNNKTKDFIIRRQLTIDEGEIITNRHMDASKARVEMLGFFEPRDGVSWKIQKIDEKNADLDLILKETKTGSFHFQIGTKGDDFDILSPAKSFQIGLNLSDRNMLGTGIQYNLGANYSRQEFGLGFNVMQPWLFNRPIFGGVNFQHRKSTYEDYKETVRDIPVENVTEGGFTLGFNAKKLYDTNFGFNVILQSLRYNPIIAKNPIDQPRIDRQFQPGNLLYFETAISQNQFNNPVYPAHGYQWNLTPKFGTSILAFNSNAFGFGKLDIDAGWVTPLIAEYDVIFFMHGHFGWVQPIANKNVPYRELYHIGGPATVRGFTFGQIGPNVRGDSVGGLKAFWVNLEVRFPITRDMSIKGLIFYDGGSGWDVLKILEDSAGKEFIRNKNFNYRHAIGFGFRLTKPAPVRLDWGFKLNRDRRLKESASEIHFTMSQDF